METDDVLADKMQVCRPVFLEQIAALPVTFITDSGDVVGEGIQPYIGDMLRIEAYRDSPGKGGPGHTEILQSRKQEVVHHLIFSGYRLDKFRMLVDVFDQLRSVLAHLEEVSFLLCRLHLPSAVRAFAVHQLGFGEERFAGCTVETFIVSLVDVSLVVELFEDLLHLLLMVVVGGADEFVIRSIHEIPDSLDFRGHLVYELLGRDACFLRFQFDLLPVFVCSGLEKYIVSLFPFEPGDTVCQHDLIGIADMRLAGCVGNGCGHVEFFLFHCLNSLLVLLGVSIRPVVCLVRSLRYHVQLTAGAVPCTAHLAAYTAR